MQSTGTDVELIAAALRGERAAFGLLVSKYQSLVCTVAYNVTRNRALSQDVAQDAFIAAWYQLHQLRNPAQFRSWLCVITRNLANKARRRTTREAATQIVEQQAEPQYCVLEDEAGAAVRLALSRIPVRYREALLLFYQQDQSLDEVAAILAISNAAAEQRIRRGRAYVAKSLAKDIERLAKEPAQPGLSAAVLTALAPTSIPLAGGDAAWWLAPHAKIVVIAAVCMIAGVVGWQFLVGRPAPSMLMAAKQSDATQSQRPVNLPAVLGPKVPMRFTGPHDRQRLLDVLRPVRSLPPRSIPPIPSTLLSTPGPIPDARIAVIEPATVLQALKDIAPFLKECGITRSVADPVAVELTLMLTLIGNDEFGAIVDEERAVIKATPAISAAYEECLHETLLSLQLPKHFSGSEATFQIQLELDTSPD